MAKLDVDDVSMDEWEGDGSGDADGETDGEQLDSSVSVIELFRLPFPLNDESFRFEQEFR